MSMIISINTVFVIDILQRCLEDTDGLDHFSGTMGSTYPTHALLRAGRKEEER